MKPLAITATTFMCFLLLSSSLAKAEAVTNSHIYITSDALKKLRVAETKPTSAREAAEKKRQKQLGKIEKLLDKKLYRKAVKEWEHLRTANQRKPGGGLLEWRIAKAYSQLHQHDKAISLYKRFYVDLNSPYSVRERADVGEELVFGEVGARPDQNGFPMGKGFCSLCHMIEFPDRSDLDPNAPPFKGVIARARERIASPEYLNRPKDTDQPEAFPGSGVATTVIEYLAESNLCPSCYVVPGFGVRGSNDRQSLELALHKPPYNLAIDELIATTTWLYILNGEEPPPLDIMRAAYDKFLRKEDRPGSWDAIKLASLYDANGNLDTAIGLIAANYEGVIRQSVAANAPSAISYLNIRDENLSRWRNDPTRFVHLKQNPAISQRFPQLLLPEN